MKPIPSIFSAAFASLLSISCLTAVAQDSSDVPELKALESRYDQAQLDKNERLREKYIMELAKLRCQLVHENKPGWEAVEAEITQHPAPADSDSKVLSKMRTGKWYSPRHTYIYRADGTWSMGEEYSTEETHGTWAIQGNHFTEAPTAGTPCIIYLLTPDTFIYGDPGSTRVFFEVRSLTKGLHISRD